ncbi:hypothetical protein OVA11_14295 [Caulobacter sp. SL161]|uniref:hypothetical protein n=1 Tax=Caulobacter sp. SL161 TaxID=2995156 RepID=UPI0022752214|nr:hypothetical protein [Caulobacter sp. SL161]MCY1648191.1 hypothetical protein [Caulobacter sp. SL161]
MRLKPLREGAASPRAWPVVDPDPQIHGLVLDFIGSKSRGRPFYKRLNDRYADLSQIPGWSYSGATSNGQPRFAETRAGLLSPFAAGEPRLTDRGLLIEEARTRYSTSVNISPTSVMSSVIPMNGAVVSVVAVADLPPTVKAAFDASPVRNITTSVYKVVMDGSQPYQGVVLSGTSAANTALCFSAFAHVEGGVAWIGQSGSTSMVNSISLGAGFTRVGRENVQSSAGRVLRLGHNGEGTSTPGTFYFILDQYDAGAFWTSPIANASNGAGASRAADIAYVTGLGVILGEPVTYGTELLSGPWTLTNAGASTVTESPAGQLNFSGDGTNTATADLSFPTEVGRLYTLRANITTDTVAVLIGTSQGGQQLLTATGLSVGQQSRTFVATATTTWLRFRRGNAGPAVASAISVKDTVPSPITLAAAADLSAYDAAVQVLAAASDAGSANRLDLERSAGATARVDGGSQGVLTGTSSAKAGARVLKGAARLRGDGSVKAAWDGVVTAGSAAKAISGMNRLDLGQRVGGSVPLNGYIQRIVVGGDLDDAQLAVLSA